MASTAGEVARILASRDFWPLIDSVSGRNRRKSVRRVSLEEQLTADSIASAGLAAVIGLPFLMLASLVLHAPLAGSAVIASGYLVIAAALASRHPRRAAVMHAAILSGLVGWSAFVFLMMEGPISSAGLTAALLAPLFAAAPALVRLAIAPKSDPAAVAALERIACLDKFAPSEAVLVLDRNGMLLAATRAARVNLRLPDNALGSDVSRSFDLFDRPLLLDAVATCHAEARPIEVALRIASASGDAKRCVAATVAADQDDSVSVCIREVAPAGFPLAPHIDRGVRRANETNAIAHDQRAPSQCDLHEALEFAVRRTGPRAEAKGVTLSLHTGARLSAACDRQICRRILYLLLEHAVTRSNPGEVVSMSARRLKSAVLLRVTSQAGTDDAIAASPLSALELAPIRALIEQADGTILVENSAAGLSLSVRLDLAAA